MLFPQARHALGHIQKLCKGNPMREVEKTRERGSTRKRQGLGPRSGGKGGTRGTGGGGLPRTWEQITFSGRDEVQMDRDLGMFTGIGDPAWLSWGLYFPQWSRRQDHLLRVGSWGCNGDLVRMVKVWNSCGGILESLLFWDIEIPGEASDPAGDFLKQCSASQG